MGSGGESRSTPLFACDIFWEHFPYYLSSGMTPEQYWRCDPRLAKAFRESSRIKAKDRNREAWVQGMYIYDTISRLSALFNPMGGGKIEPYVGSPYGESLDKEEISADVAKNKAAVSKKKEKSDAQIAFEQWAILFNERFEKGGKDA